METVNIDNSEARPTMDFGCNYLVQIQKKDSQSAPRTVVVPANFIDDFLNTYVHNTFMVCVISSVETFIPDQL